MSRTALVSLSSPDIEGLTITGGDSSVNCLVLPLVTRQVDTRSILADTQNCLARCSMGAKH